MRSIGDPDYRYRPISEERKARLSEIHRKRWGAPEGFCTVRGVHVPFEHRAPVRYWSDWLAHGQGEDAARSFVEDLKAKDWSGMERLWELYRERKAIAETAKQIRAAQWELAHGN